MTHYWCFVWTWWISSEPTSSDLTRSYSGNNQEQQLNNPCPEVVFSACHTSNLNHLEQEETQPTVTGVQGKNPYCSPRTSSGNQKKARSTSQLQFCSENTPATIEAGQILLGLQQLASNSNSANFFSNISRISNSLTTTMPNSDGKTQKFELFKIHNQLTEEGNLNYFQSLMSDVALKLFKTSPALTRKASEKFWLCSAEKTSSPSQWLKQNTIFNDWTSTQRTRI